MERLSPENSNLKVTLPEQLANLVRQQLDSGHYASPEEVIAAALKLLDQRDKQVAALREDIQEGPASGSGRNFDQGVVEDIKQRGRERSAQRKNSG